jgi:hypothetical protein
VRAGKDARVHLRVFFTVAKYHDGNHLCRDLTHKVNGEAGCAKRTPKTTKNTSRSRKGSPGSSATAAARTVHSANKTPRTVVCTRRSSNVQQHQVSLLIRRVEVLQYVLQGVARRREADDAPVQRIK